MADAASMVVNLETGLGARSLERGLRILLSFSAERREWTTREVAAALNIPVASAYRVVGSLEAAGFIERQGSGPTFGLGLQIVRLASIVLSGSDLRAIARPIMEQLVAEVGETVVLLVPGRDLTVCIDYVEGTSPIRPRSLKVGDYVPYNGGAAPLAIFAFLPEQDQKRIMRTSLGQLTDKTIIDPKMLRERCSQIIKTKVSRSSDEVIPGTAAVAVPLFHGVPPSIVGSIGVTGLEARLVGVEDHVLAAADAISQRLGEGGGIRGVGEPGSQLRR